MTRVRRSRPPVVAVGAVPTSALEPAEVVPVDVEPGDDPAVLAEAARAAACAAREAGARAVAEAQEQAARLVEAAQREASQLELRARAADAEAARWQERADRDAAIIGTSAEVETLQAARDRLAQDAAETELEIARLECRLEELAAASNEAAQRRVAAVRTDDEAALRDAFAALAASGELHQARTADLAAARDRLARLRGEHEDVCGRLGRASLRLIALRRAEAGLPPVEEVVEVTLAALPLLVTSMMASSPDRLSAILLGAVPAEARPVMAEAIKLGSVDPQRTIALVSNAAGLVLGPQVVAALQQLALDDREQYEGVKRLVLAPGESVASRRAADEAAGMVASLLEGGAR